MKKGFTLIELLSVIVVLAIIAVIAVPTIIGVVNKTKLQSLKSSAYGLIEAGTLYNAEYGNTNNARFDIMNNVVTTTASNKIKYKGHVKQGTIIVSTKGKVSVCVTDGKNSAYKNYNDTEVTLVSKKTCSVPANTSVVYLDGEATIDSVDAKAILDRLDALEQSLANSKQGTVKSVQRGSLSFTTSYTQDITINEVNPSKSVLLITGGGGFVGGNAGYVGSVITGRITSSTSIRLEQAQQWNNFTASYPSKADWQVIEYY